MMQVMEGLDGGDARQATRYTIGIVLFVLAVGVDLTIRFVNCRQGRRARATVLLSAGLVDIL